MQAATREALIERPRRLVFASALIACASLPSTGCGDPVSDEKIAALGGESRGARPGPLHRPNQPCLLCHRVGGLAPAFSVAGTVYKNATSAQALADAEVVLIDSSRTTFVARTNEVGNFYVEPGDLAPKLPVWVSIRSGTDAIAMESPMNREADCGACHQDPKGPDEAGHVYATVSP